MDSIKYHPACLLFPAMSDEEFDALVEDIRANGLRDAVIMWKDEVLEGRHRLAACKLAGREPHFEEWDGKGSPIAFVASKNLHRRHLSDSQRAAIAAELAERMEAEDAERALATRGEKVPDDVPKPMGRPKVSRTEDAAGAVNAGMRSTQRARRVKSLDPAMHERVKAGEITVKEAEEQIVAKPAPAPPPNPVDLIGAKVGSILETLGPVEREIRELCDLDPSRDRAKCIETLGKLIAAVKGQKRRMTPKPVDETDRYVEQLWQLYPRKEGKGQAVKAIEKSLKTVSFFDLKPAVEEYAEAVATWPADDLQYVPHAATWFNGRRWEDDRTMWRSRGAPQRNNKLSAFDEWTPPVQTTRVIETTARRIETNEDQDDTPIPF